MQKAPKYLQKFKDIIDYVLKYYQNVPELSFILQKKQKFLIIIDKIPEAADTGRLNLGLLMSRYPNPTESILYSVKLQSKIFFIQNSPEFIPSVFHLIFLSQSLQNNHILKKALDLYTPYLIKKGYPQNDFLQKVRKFLDGF